MIAQCSSCHKLTVFEEVTSLTSMLEEIKKAEIKLEYVSLNYMVGSWRCSRLPDSPGHRRGLIEKLVKTNLVEVYEIDKLTQKYGIRSRS